MTARVVLTTNEKYQFCEFTDIPKSVNPIKGRPDLKEYCIQDDDKIWGCWDIDINLKGNEGQEDFARLGSSILISEQIIKTFPNKIRCDLRRKHGVWGLKGLVISEKLMSVYPKLISEIK